MQVKLKTTDVIRQLLSVVDSLDDAKEQMFQPVKWWQRGPSLSDKVAFIRELGIARARLWEQVYAVYPEVTEHVATVNTDCITYEDGK
jgi:hypothetical protein